MHFNYLAYTMPSFIPYRPARYDRDEEQRRSDEFYKTMNHRRSVRSFSDRPVPKELIETIIKTAGTAPSGANKQPWTFVVVTDPLVKEQIRTAAEKEERESYEHRMPQEWLEDLEALGTDWHKEFLTTAPALIVVFSRNYEKDKGNIKKNYYVKESVGIACGFLLAAIHNAGLVSLTHTPSPMDFLTSILHRPDNEKPFLLIPVGYAPDDITVPDIHRKPLDEILRWK